jgi:hypothetical protein
MGVYAGPFLQNVPTPPMTWTDYATGYVPNADGTFVVSTSSSTDNASVQSPN